VLCAPSVAARVRRVQDLLHEPLLRSYRAEDWPGWFAAAGIDAPAIRGPVFDSSRLMVEAAMQGAGVALAPASMFVRELQDGRLAQPLSIEVMAGDYWLTRLRSRPSSPSMKLFRDWLLGQTGAVS
jgi:LysR family transcriptional regulator of beta-lactamase